MASTLTCLLYHVIYSVKDRQPMIQGDFQRRLHEYLGGVIRRIDGKALSVGGTADHVHLLIMLKADMPLSKAVNALKANSSKWVNRTFPNRRHFVWQRGYGAYSVSFSNKDAVARYIERQAEHHRKRSFQEECRMFLEKHAIAYDERYLWG